jgi:hypothetical protein
MTRQMSYLLHLLLLLLMLELQLLHLQLLLAPDRSCWVLPQPRAALRGVPVPPPRVLLGSTNTRHRGPKVYHAGAAPMEFVR